MVRREIQCDVEGCEARAVEQAPGRGWPGWGDIRGRRNAETGETTFHLCPEHLNEVFKHLEAIGNGNLD